MTPVLERIEHAIAQQDPVALDNALSYLSIHLEASKDFPDQALDCLVKCLASDKFAAMNKSFYLLRIFEEELDRLTDPQRQKLLEVLEQNLARYADIKTCYLAVEIIACLFCDERSLAPLERLKAIQAMPQRTAMPHAFRWFVLYCGDEALQKRALASLEELTRDQQSDVAELAKMALIKTTSKLPEDVVEK